MDVTSQDKTALPVMKSKHDYMAPQGTAVPPDNYDDNQDSTTYETAEPSMDAEITEEMKGGLRKLIKQRPLMSWT